MASSAERTLAVGIDIGNDKCVLAVSTNGVVDAVLNEEGKRHTPAVVHFAANHRLFGTAAATYATAYPRSTISQLKRLVVNADRQDQDVLPYDLSQGDDGEILITVGGQWGPFTPTQMLGMLLGHLKRSAEKTLGCSISACVLGVPEYFQHRQRKAYEDAAVIAGLKPLKLLSEGTATALEYACSRTATDNVSSTTVAFVDIGHSATQVTVVSFEDEQPKTLGKASDSNLGGRDFDDLIYELVINRLKHQHGHNLGLSEKAKARLRVACEKAKKVLSVNREAQVNLEGLGDGSDVCVVIKREEFESKSRGLLGTIVDKFREALGDAGLNDTELDFVELVGSGSRVPAISTALTNHSKVKLWRTLNGTECVARGCALQCEKLLTSDQMRREKHGLLGSLFMFFLNLTELCFRLFLDIIHLRFRSFFGTIWSRLLWLIRWLARGGKGGDAIPHLPPDCPAIRELRDQELRLLEQDDAAERAKKLRNDLETMIYATLNKVSGKHLDVVHQQVKEMELWLYAEGEVAHEGLYRKKIEELNSVLAKNNIH